MNPLGIQNQICSTTVELSFIYCMVHMGRSPNLRYNSNYTYHRPRRLNNERNAGTEESAVCPSRMLSQAPRMYTHCTCDVQQDKCFLWTPEPKFCPKTDIFQDTELSGIIFSIVMLNISPRLCFDCCHFTGPRGLVLVLQSIEYASVFAVAGTRIY